MKFQPLGLVSAGKFTHLKLFSVYCFSTRASRGETVIRKDFQVGEYSGRHSPLMQKSFNSRHVVCWNSAAAIATCDIIYDGVNLYSSDIDWEIRTEIFCVIIVCLINKIL